MRAAKHCVLNPLFPGPNGEIFACMAETITTGLVELSTHFSLGGITKEQVFRALELAGQVGIQLGSIKRLRVF